MSTVAVVVNTKKVGEEERARVRQALAGAGVPDPVWYDVPKSKKAAARARQAVDEGADLLLVWGGDGTVQRCVDAVAGRDVALAVIPGGTSNLLARALDLPSTPVEAALVGLGGGRRTLDTGTVNGEHFAVVAGAGLDARLVRDTDSEAKDRWGRAAYLLTGVRHLGMEAQPVVVEVDGREAFRGASTSVLVANTRRAVGGLDVLDASEPDDGVLEVAVVTAEGPLEWARAAARAVAGSAEDSPSVWTAQGRSVVFRFERPVTFEVDGGERKPTRTLQVQVRPRSLTVCVPAPDGGPDRG